MMGNVIEKFQFLCNTTSVCALFAVCFIVDISKNVYTACPIMRLKSFCVFTLLILSFFIVCQLFITHFRYDSLLSFPKKSSAPTSATSRHVTLPPSPDLSVEATAEGDPPVENLPFDYLERAEYKTRKYNNTCAIYPNLFDIKFTNDHWQTQSTSNGTLQLFNAYLDRRVDNQWKNVTYVRIVGMIDRLNLARSTSPPPFFCQFWFENQTKPLGVAMTKIDMPWHPAWGPKSPLFFPYIFSCPVDDESGGFPVSVSVVEKFCENATNNLRVNYRRYREKRDFVVCVKGLNFPFSDYSVRLVEWIEALFLLGANKLNLYTFHLHPRLHSLLSYYASNRSAHNIEITPLSLVGPFSNHPHLQDLFLHKKIVHRRLQETIPYNDCLYKHLHQYKYVVLLDTDEIIVPTVGPWLPMIEQMRAKFKSASSFMARNVYFMDNAGHKHDFFDDVPPYMHMLQHVYRAKNYTKVGSFVKGFHDTDQVVALHNHLAMACIAPKCAHKDIDLSLGHLQHYRKDCAGGISKESCNDFKKNFVMDRRLWNIKEKLIKNVNRVLNDLDIVP